jgi:hypothetical protein
MSASPLDLRPIAVQNAHSSQTPFDELRMNVALAGAIRPSSGVVDGTDDQPRMKTMVKPDGPDEQTMVRAAVAELDAKLPSVQRSRIEPTVRRIVRWWLTRARIRTFAGIIAARQAREELETHTATRE